MQSLHKGRDRQCRTHPKQAVYSELVKTAPSFYTDVGKKKGALHQNAEIASPSMMATHKKQGLQD